MKTISANEFCDNLDSVLTRVIAGEEIIVKHRLYNHAILQTCITKNTHISSTLPGLDASTKPQKRNTKSILPSHPKNSTEGTSIRNINTKLFYRVNVFEDNLKIVAAIRNGRASFLQKPRNN